MSVQDSPLDCYRQDLQSAGYHYDPAQEKVVHYAQALYQAWLARDRRRRGFWSRWFAARTPVKGLYIWGGVGRGKTYLLDRLYRTLPTARKTRVHFHQFMQDIHAAMQPLRSCPDPLELVAQQVVDKVDALFIDEFHVEDITDAMLLAGLLQGLFRRGLTLVTTSNIHVDRLYRDGLQRDRFLPAIALLKKHLHVIELEQGTDYRGQVRPLSSDAQEQALRDFLEQRGVPVSDHGKRLMVNRREIQARAVHHRLAWFDFDALCETPRSVADYIELAQRFDEIVVTGIPVFDECNESAALRFVRMIDAFYDQHVRLVYQLPVPVEQLYQGRAAAFQFQRTLSRLLEMGSSRYQQDSEAGHVSGTSGFKPDYRRFSGSGMDGD